MGRLENDVSTLDHYTTPERVWGPIVQHMGPIGLDPFSNPHSKVPARVKFTNWGPKHLLPDGMFQADGFIEPWGGYGLTFVNGPFSLAGEVLRCCAQKGDEVIFLTRSNMNARYVHKWALPSDRIFFFDRRLTFEGETDQAPFHCMLGYWGTRPEIFELVCKHIGGWVVPGKVS